MAGRVVKCAAVKFKPNGYFHFKAGLVITLFMVRYKINKFVLQTREKRKIF